MNDSTLPLCGMAECRQVKPNPASQPKPDQDQGAEGDWGGGRDGTYALLHLNYVKSILF